MAADAKGHGSRRQWVLLGVLLMVLIAVLAIRWRGMAGPAAGSAGSSRNQARAGRATAGAGAKNTTPADELDVHIDALQREREKPAEIERNPFRFEARRSAMQEGQAAARPVQPAPAPVQPAVPAGPPPPPPIPLKFIGIIESPEAGRVASLTDGHRVFNGRVGEIIDGRYRIVRIGVESIVLEYADGSGSQQTIRLSGS